VLQANAAQRSAMKRGLGGHLRWGYVCGRLSVDKMSGWKPVYSKAKILTVAVKAEGKHD